MTAYAHRPSVCCRPSHRGVERPPLPHAALEHELHHGPVGPGRLWAPGAPW
ncbi:predicted protein [Streptomyces sp. C]|nr:predicted protein [Streptomyces sp. C]